jgi:hypothetical protein
MPKVRIFWSGLTEEEKRELLALLAATDCEILSEAEADDDVALAPSDQECEPTAHWGGVERRW